MHVNTLPRCFLPSLQNQHHQASCFSSSLSPFLSFLLPPLFFFELHSVASTICFLILSNYQTSAESHPQHTYTQQQLPPSCLSSRYVTESNGPVSRHCRFCNSPPIWPHFCVSVFHCASLLLSTLLPGFAVTNWPNPFFNSPPHPPVSRPRGRSCICHSPLLHASHSVLRHLWAAIEENTSLCSLPLPIEYGSTERKREKKTPKDRGGAKDGPERARQLAMAADDSIKT